jgi:hypothetical protein
MKARAILIALSALWSAHVFAWGNDGHRVTGDIAVALLNDSARRELREILGNDDLARIATELDDDREQFERRHPGASRWHYENREVCGMATVTCPRNECVTQQIERFIRVLKNRGASRAQRTEAITVLVHLIGDMHQPLHLADNHDRGGNDVWVQLPRDREPRRLHEVWDVQFVHRDMQRRPPSSYAHSLLIEFEPRVADWQQGGIQSWATETYTLGKQYAYQALPGFACTALSVSSNVVSLPASYVDESRKIVAEQLAKAGARIAQILNSELGAGR